MVNLTLPTDSDVRKEYPLMRCCVNYFPAALAGVARHSFVSNEKHNPGEEPHHVRGKSNDHGDCIYRHLMDMQDMLASIPRGVEDVYAFQRALLVEANALAWRALALSQELHEKYAGAPLAPAARLPAAPVEDFPRPLGLSRCVPAKGWACDENADTGRCGC